MLSTPLANALVNWLTNQFTRRKYHVDLKGLSFSECPVQSLQPVKSGFQEARFQSVFVEAVLAKKCLSVCKSGCIIMQTYLETSNRDYPQDTSRSGSRWAKTKKGINGHFYFQVPAEKLHFTVRRKLQGVGSVMATRWYNQSTGFDSWPARFVFIIKYGIDIFLFRTE